MTSHKFDARSSDKIDTLIRWTLQQEIGQAQSPRHAWRRIYTKLERWQRFGGGFGGLLRRVFQTISFCIQHLIAFWWLQDDCVEWRVDPRYSEFLIDQYSFFFLLRRPDIIQ